MAKLQVKTLEKLTQYMEFVENHQKQAKGPLWFRGCSSFREHRLLPALNRHPKRKALSERATLEQELLAYFRQRSIPFGTPSLDGDWEPLFFMQHYGIPTRLLDWSESPLVGLYFAVTNSHTNKAGRQADAAVWILDPTAWNRHALNNIQYSGGILSMNDDALKGHAYRHDYTSMNSHPVALYGSHNSRRIVAQRGVFTVFGQSALPMETAYEKAGFPSTCLLKVKLPGRKLASIHESLRRTGMTASVIFPDLEGFAQELRSYFQFEA